MLISIKVTRVSDIFLVNLRAGWGELTKPSQHADVGCVGTPVNVATGHAANVR